MNLQTEIRNQIPQNGEQIPLTMLNNRLIAFYRIF
jgi:hypothetical protein